MNIEQPEDKSGTTWLARNGGWIRFLCHAVLTYAAYRIFLVSGTKTDIGFIPILMAFFHNYPCCRPTALRTKRNILGKP
jgi:hypothetical protein